MPKRHPAALVIFLPPIAALAILWHDHARRTAAPPPRPAASYYHGDKPDIFVDYGDPRAAIGHAGDGTSASQRYHALWYGYARRAAESDGAYPPLPRLAFQADVSRCLSSNEYGDNGMGYSTGPAVRPAVFGLIDLGPDPPGISQATATIVSVDENQDNPCPMASYAWSDDGVTFHSAGSDIAGGSARSPYQVNTFVWTARQSAAHRYWQVRAHFAAPGGSSVASLKITEFHLYDTNRELVEPPV